MKIGAFLLLVLRNLGTFLFGAQPFPVSFSGLTFKIRPRSSGFVILLGTFVRRIYLPRRPLRKVETVVDLGAYIGDFSVWAARQYNPKTIVAVEPDPGLYNLMAYAVKKNKLEKTIHTVRKAMYSKNTRLAAKQEMIHDSATEFFQEDKNGMVSTTTLLSLIKTYKLGRVDYFKMDIEGGEKFVLTEENKNFFREKVRFISFETHEKWGFGSRDAVRYFESIGFEVVQLRRIGKNTEFEGYNLRFGNS